MHTRYLDRIPYDDDDALGIVRHAAMNILRRYGRVIFNGLEPMNVAFVDGYTVRYYPLAADAKLPPESIPNSGERRSDRAAWTYCIEVEASELLFDMVVGSGGHAIRRMVRGPWEHDIVWASDLAVPPNDALPLPPFVPESGCRKILSISPGHDAKLLRLRAPMRFSVTGYTQCAHGLVPPGSNFVDVVDAVAEGFRRSRTHGDHHRTSFATATSAFGLWAWSGERSVRLGKRMTKPDIAYWISSSGGCEAAAELLLHLDRASTRTARSSKPAVA